MPRAKRICPKPGCPHAAVKRYCTEHEREYEQQRGTREQRGYDHRHRELRKTFIPAHQAGTLICWRCNQLILSSEPFDLGHDDKDRTITRGPEHAGCNRSAAGRSAHQ